MFKYLLARVLLEQDKTNEKPARVISELIK